MIKTRYYVRYIVCIIMRCYQRRIMYTDKEFNLLFDIENKHGITITYIVCTMIYNNRNNNNNTRIRILIITIILLKITID